MLRTLVDQNQNNWDDILPKVLLSYRSSEQSSTKFSPSFIMFGRELKLPIDVEIGSITNQYENTREYVQETAKQMKQALTEVRNNLNEVREREKEWYDRKVYGNPYRTGQRVMLFCPATKKGKSRKLTKQWRGPFIITQENGDGTYKIRQEGGRLVKVAHFNNLKPAAEQRENELQNISKERPVHIPEQTELTQVEVDEDTLPDDLLDKGNPDEPVEETETAEVGRQIDQQAVESESSTDSSSESEQTEGGGSNWRPQTTRIGRVTRKPAHLNDYV